MLVCSSVVLLNPGGWVTLNFTSFALELGYDFLFAFDGPSVRAPLLGQYSGNDLMHRVISARDGASAIASAWESPSVAMHQEIVKLSESLRAWLDLA